MNFTTIITAWTPWQAVELVCIVYCADYLHIWALLIEDHGATTTPPTASTRHRRWTLHSNWPPEPTGTRSTV